MRVVEPDPRGLKSYKKKSKKFKRSYVFLFILLAVFSTSGFLVYKQAKHEKNQSVVSKQETTAVADEQQDVLQATDDGVLTLRNFTDAGFRAFYDNLLQQNLDRVENPPVITGNDIADTRIRAIGEARGYRLRHSPTIKLASVDGFLLQPVVVEPWLALKKAALVDGIEMNIVSAYRSIEEQRRLFLSELASERTSIEAVAAGEADDAINNVLITAAIPGYSKHHTGYAFDLICPGYAFENFKDSTCFDWISADNYRVAKEYGFIPSYPPLVVDQGPNPEAWEYVYVGPEALYE